MNEKAYQAMMKAADFIERNPGRYSFMATRVGDLNGNCPACMWGWFGFFLGFRPGGYIFKARKEAGFHGDEILYDFRHGEFEGFQRDSRMAGGLMRAFANHHRAKDALDPAFLKFRDSLTAKPLAA
jgi:hypothetical protein